jgi:pyruvate dehydrogenase (quinone)
MAEAAGLLGLTAERPAQVQPMMAQAFAHEGPAQATGFGMFMIKAVLNGRGDEIIDLAKTNLWR